MGPDDSVVDAARCMDELNVGDKLVGMVTDRDIVVRGVAQRGELAGMKLVASERLVGIVSLGDIAAKNPDDEGDVAMSLGDISSPAEPDRH